MRTSQLRQVVTGWGGFPRVTAVYHRADSIRQARALVSADFTGITRGLGRSYGDSALATSILDCTALDSLIEFDEHLGVLRCEAGTSILTLTEVFLPRGWCLPVTPGTQFVTVGGAIASDVHGKNHQQAGCFSQHVLDLQLLLPSGLELTCSATENVDLFRATCSGMGLTGIITSATIQLKKITSNIMLQQTRVAKDFDELLDLYLTHPVADYSVAWVDALSTGRYLGRAILSLAHHAADGGCSTQDRRNLTIPRYFPGFFLNRATLRLFNACYFHRARIKAATNPIPYVDYFYPLDRLCAWNRLYGRRGFLQYQCVLPDSTGHHELKRLFRFIVQSQCGSFLAVLKRFGATNQNWLSFPMPGFSLALDFKIDSKVWALLDELDRRVMTLGGRVYLAKDARLQESAFKAMYPNWAKLSELRQRYGLTDKLTSLQSQRLGLY